MQLMQEKLDLIPDARVLILEKHADIDNFTLKFQHVVQDQMSYNHKCLTPNMWLRVMQEGENILSLFIEDVGETIEEVTNCNDDIGFDSKVNVRSQKLKEELNVSYAHLRRDTHEFAKSQNCRSLQNTNRR